MDNKQTRESGQAIVIIVLAIVVLLGFVAIAIDGGMAYSDRRHAQNAADAAALAGGGAAAIALEDQYIYYNSWDCNHMSLVKEAAITAAIGRAADNGFSIDDDPADGNGVTFECKSEDNGSYVDKYIDVTTYISDTTTTYFAQFVFGGVLRNNVQATARIRPRTSVAFGNAVVAVHTECQDSGTGGVHFGGNTGANVTGGGIFSNACVTNSGDANQITLEEEFNITCTGNNCDSKWKQHGNVPDPNNGQYPLPREMFIIPAPTCPAPTTTKVNVTGSTQEVIGPGYYQSINIVSNNAKLTLEPGLYCIGGHSSSEFKANGGWITGENVTIYMVNGSFNVSSADKVTLSAPPARTCPTSVCPPAVPGVLVFVDENNTDGVSLTGNADSLFQGMIYAPNATISVNGTADAQAIRSQLVGKTVDLFGNATIDVQFDDKINYSFPARLELAR